MDPEEKVKKKTEASLVVSYKDMDLCEMSWLYTELANEKKLWKKTFASNTRFIFAVKNQADRFNLTHCNPTPLPPYKQTVRLYEYVCVRALSDKG